ncbi:DUF1127 domain-containing protein [Nitrogeniibacter mangrovi]|uniref:DUF1127 domain-containing protein n=1 Tax=Nitrogeniibacter mangrovi TaxID=2016596 RepID=A0A6C1B646_9RHOO|nr:DUF1127 domain-containing protein [Nitrogeniibacter mangrovi]QID19206.1 DUF1127 domain-containing protein [Nitrogeniibacter mangrovi]
MLQHTRPALLPARLGRSRAPRLQRWGALLRLWRQRARSRAELRELDERLLRDIGISREMARFVGQKPFWRP